MDKHTQRRPIKPMEYEEQKASESKKAHEPSGKSRQLHAPVIEPHPHPQAQPPRQRRKSLFGSVLPPREEMQEGTRCRA